MSEATGSAATTGNPVRVLHPDIRVKLIKLVKRETVDGSIPAAARYTGADRIMDLTPFLSDLAGTVHTQKSVSSPAGAFSITLSDRAYGENAAMESLYGLIEPMDGIEIRATHNHGRPTREPPIIMRGFVTTISRGQSVDGRGAPTRTVTIEGHDYGKIWQMLQVLYRPFNVMGEVFLSNFRLFERFGLAMNNQLGRDFVAQVVERIINAHLATMLPQDWPMPRSITPDCTVPEGLTSVSGSQNQEGRIYDLLAYFGDVSNGFNELFIEDRPDSVAAVYRPNPALDLAGRPIQAPSGNPDYLPHRQVIPAADIVSMDLSRSDADVANYFWVDDTRHELVLPLPQQYSAATSAERSTVFMENYPNNLPSIYGMRPMIVATQMGDSNTFGGGRPASEEAQRQQQNAAWLHRRRRILAMTNRDNAVLETGTVRITGNENIRAGGFIELGRGALAAPYYVAAVAHDYVAFKGFFTTLYLERGQGFARRIQAAGSIAPYLLDLGAGARESTAPSASGAPAPPSIGQAGPPGTPEGTSPRAAEQGPPPSTAAQRTAAPAPPINSEPGYQPSPTYAGGRPPGPANAPGTTYTPEWTTPPPPAGRNGAPIPDWTSPTGFRDAAGNPVEPNRR